MTKTSLLVPLLLGMSASALADDLIMLRNGDEINGKISKISDKEITFNIKSGNLIFKNVSADQSVPTGEVYMVKTEKRGTIFFIDGERIMKESRKSDKGADYIYLVCGAEIPAWNLSLNNGTLTYQKDKSTKKALSNISSIPVSEVFLVKYSDGSKDIFTELLPANQKEESKNETPVQMKVVFHNVLKGETLGSIAEKYNVEVESIKEWNEFPSSFTPSTQLKSGTQIMLQVNIN